MSTLSIANTSRLPIPATKDKNPAVRGGSRRALGDITSQQINSKPVIAKENKKQPRLTRLASRRLADPASKPLIEPKDEVLGESNERVLPHDVKDIDTQDEGNPQLCAEYAMEMFVYLRQLEERGSVRFGHLSGCPTNDKMRAVLIDWLVEVQMQFKLLQETLFGTINIVDRYLAVEGSSVTRSRLQLVGVSCMFLAAKMEEVYAPACSDFVYITDNAYTEDEIKKTEIKIIQALQFNLFQPLSLHFLRRFSKAGDVDVLQHSLAKYALEVGLLDYALVSRSGSELAAAALFLSLLLLEPGTNTNTVWTTTLAYYSNYKRDQLLPTVAKLAAGIVGISAKSCKLQAVKVKYQSGKFLKVADLSELKGEVIKKLAGL